MINKKLNKSGTFWQKDYFDKAIRDDKHFEVVLEYVKNNAYKAGLSDADDRFVYVCDE
jgi:REP element-mobilizing transposase RayT